MKSLFLLFPLLWFLPSCSKPAAKAVAAPEAEAEPLVVSIQAVSEQSMPRFLRVTGELRSAQESMVAADTPGKVVSASIERGSKVQVGGILVQLDDLQATLSLREAEATLAGSQANLDWQRSELARNEPLAKTKAISDTDFQKLKSQLASVQASHLAATARRDLAKKTLTDMAIRAPFSGTVAERLTNVGEFVSSNAPVVSLVATDRLRLALNVPETSVGALQVGQDVSFDVPAYTGRSFTGKVKFIGAAIRAASRDLIVEAEVANPDDTLKPGMFAEARISLGEATALTIPKSSLRTEGATRKVFIVSEQRVVERLVEPGESQGDAIEIRSGLAKGDAVILSPSHELVDGRLVNVSGK